MSRWLCSLPILLVELASLTTVHGFLALLLQPEPLAVPAWWLVALLFLGGLAAGGLRPWPHLGIGAGLTLGLWLLEGPITACAGLYLWWSGGLLARLGLTQHPAVYHFAWRTTLFMVLSGLLAYWGEPIVLTVPSYFGAALAALSLARSEQLERWAGHGGSSQRFSLGLALLLVGFGLALALLFDPHWGRWFLGGAGGFFASAVSWVWLTLVGPLLKGPLWLLQQILTPFIRWVWSLAADPLEAPLQLPLEGLLKELAEAEQAAGPPSPFLWVLRSLVFALAVFLVVRWVRARMGRVRGQAAADLTESLFSWQQLWADLGGLLAPRRPALPEADPSGMRAVYRSFLSWGARRGAVRQRSETPSVYGQHWSDQRVAVVTEAYEKARYGAALPSADEVEAARRALSELGQTRG